MNFFDPRCQTGPHLAPRFGLCDDERGGVAFVDEQGAAHWVATVENPARRPVTFTAIDKCVLGDVDAPGRGRCDAMLTTGTRLMLVELKFRKKRVSGEMLAQLESTIRFLLEHHQIEAFRTKKAYACNGGHRSGFIPIEHTRKAYFRHEYDFHIDISPVIKIEP